ncbi:hypothetical protein D9M68_18870 [compost metagenome]
MYIGSHERTLLGVSANLSREETFSRRQQQSNAILMKWDRRKANLVLKYNIGVTRKVLNDLKNVSYTHVPRDIDPTSLTGRVKLDEVTVFKVMIDGSVREVVTRLHTSGAVMFQFLEKDSGKIKIEAIGQRSAHASMPEPFIMNIVGYSSHDEVYRELMVSILDYLINGEPVVPDQPVYKEDNLPVIWMKNPAEFEHELSDENNPVALSLPYGMFVFNARVGKFYQTMIVNRLADTEVFVEFRSWQPKPEDCKTIATGLITLVDNGHIDLTIKIDDPKIERESARGGLLLLVGLMKALEDQGVETTNHYRGKGNDSIPIPPAALENGFNVIRYVIGKVKAGKSSWKGGTHASPREHTRQAHDRVTASGEVVRIPETVVNRDVGGTIMKMYVLTKS